MISDEKTVMAARLMSEFARRTGLHPTPKLSNDTFGRMHLRFAIFWNYSGGQAIKYIDAVQRIWSIRCTGYSGGTAPTICAAVGSVGLMTKVGRQHPTSGGLRIGKPLGERPAGEPIDERLEWDRDGQYFHYLTKWMHALCRAGFVTGNNSHSRWAVELGEAAFRGFVRRSRSGEVAGVYWKMSTDLSRPLVAATGQHDALDGYITFREAQFAASKMPIDAGVADLNGGIKWLSGLCEHRDWTTDDPLGVGGLLFDACRLCQLPGQHHPGDVPLLKEITQACERGIVAFRNGRNPARPAPHRLAFRELGLAIGLEHCP